MSAVSRDLVKAGRAIENLPGDLIEDGKHILESLSLFENPQQRAMLKRQSAVRKAKAARSNALAKRKRPAPTNRAGRAKLNELLNSTAVAPVSYSTRVQTFRPKVVPTINGTRVRHRELLKDTVNGNMTWSSTATGCGLYQLNPGLAVNFPWLSSVAQKWEQYRVHSLCVEFVPTSATSSPGEIILTPIYDASEPAPDSEQHAVDDAGTVADSVWKRVRIDFDPKAMMCPGPRKYVRSVQIAGDIKNYDVGYLFVSVNNCSGGGAIGKLYIEYDIEFFVPQFEAPPNRLLYSTQLTNAGNETYTTNTATPGFSSGVTTVFDPLGWASTVAGSGVFTPPAGAYRISCSVGGSDSSNENFTVALQFYKNGQAINSLKFQNSALSDGASPDLTVMGETLITLNGTDTFNVEITLIGAAGTLTVGTGKLSIIVSLT